MFIIAGGLSFTSGVSRAGRPWSVADDRRVTPYSFAQGVMAFPHVATNLSAPYTGETRVESPMPQQDAATQLVDSEHFFQPLQEHHNKVENLVYVCRPCS